jgi:RNA polymerase sigma-70 factor (ECF subfamily)
MTDWQALLNQEGRVVWRTVYRILGNSADAEECFQEVFLAGWQVSRETTVHCWHALLLRLASARAIDRLRQRRRRGSREQQADWDCIPSSLPPPTQALEEEELLERLREALVQLPPQQAEIFCLHSLEGCSYQEIAQQLVLSVDAVGVLLHRARKRLRELLGDFAAKKDVG